jgi:hypothetical protein
MFKKIYYFFDKFEDHVRGKLSRYPIIYALIGGAAIVLFWRGVWHTADDLNVGSVASLLISIVILLATGLFTASFIGDQIIISGLRHEKKVTETTEEEIVEQENKLDHISRQLEEIRKELKNRK